MFKMTLWLAAASFVLTSCGKDDKNAANAGSSLIGSSWVGTFKAAADKASTSSKNVKLSLSPSNTFEINIINDLTSAMKGTFRDMPKNRALIFTVEESGADLLGLSGETYDYNYDFGGDELTLDGSQGRYLLQREGSGAETKPADHPLEGDWRCSSDSASTIFLNISTGSFRGRKEESGARVVYFEGEIERSDMTKDKHARVLLNVKSSNAASIAGNKLLLIEREKSKANLFQADKTGNATSETSLACSK